MEKIPPVKEGQVLDLRVEDIGSKGDAIAKLSGYVIIIAEKGLQKGDKVIATVTKIGRSCAFAEVVADG